MTNSPSVLLFIEHITSALVLSVEVGAYGIITDLPVYRGWKYRGKIEQAFG